MLLKNCFCNMAMRKPLLKNSTTGKISKSNLYNYFKSKDEIFNRLTDKAAHEFRKLIEFFPAISLSRNLIRPALRK